MHSLLAILISELTADDLMFDRRDFVQVEESASCSSTSVVGFEEYDQVAYSYGGVGATRTGGTSQVSDVVLVYECSEVVDLVVRS